MRGVIDCSFVHTGRSKKKTVGIKKENKKTGGLN